jgi:hypothetical protein
MTGEAHMIEMLEGTKRCGHLEVDWYSSIRLGYCQLIARRFDILYAGPRTCSSLALAFSRLFFGETTRGSFLQTSELISDDDTT